MADFSARRVCLSPEDKKRLVAVLSGFLEGLPEVRFAYLYGSFLDDLPGRDLDVGIFFDPALSREEVLDRVLDLGFDLGRLTGVNVDVQALNHAPAALRFHAVRGLLLLCRDEEERLSFVETAIREYLNFRPLAGQVLEDLLAP
jgi:predicted nucleotidyltransferase